MVVLSRRAALRTAAIGAAAAGLRAQSADAATPTDQRSSTNVNERRYLGCSPADLKKPYAKYMQPATLPPQPQVTKAVWAPPTPAARIPAFANLADDLNGPGYSAVENGYGMLADGRTVWAAALTRMPGVTAAMWDWWFGWHSSESARYRLWHPDAHAYAAIANDTRGNRRLTDRQRYIGNTSYVDEFIGGQLEQLAISFDDPAAAGFKTSATNTVVYGRVGSSGAGLEMGYLAHQVRPMRGGAEMRSRFYLNIPGAHVVDPTAALAAHNRGDGPMLAQPLPFTVPSARTVLEHCGREMNHLASFLPRLYREFRDYP